MKKKAALCLLKLYRKHTDFVPIAEWAGNLVALMEDDNLGVVLSVVNLLHAVVQTFPDAFQACVPKVIERLHKVSESRDDCCSGP